MASATAQINVRLDRDLKQRGDAALAEMGISPSDAVRALWAKAAMRGKSLEAVKKLLFASDESPATMGETSPVRQGWALADGFYESAGFDHAQGQLEDQPWDELYHAAMDERYTQKGVYL